MSFNFKINTAQALSSAKRSYSKASQSRHPNAQRYEDNVLITSDQNIILALATGSGRQTSNLIESNSNQIIVDRLPQRPETSTGGKSRQQKKKQTLQQVYGV